MPAWVHRRFSTRCDHGSVGPGWWLEGLVSKIRGGRGSGLVRRTTARVMLMDCRLPARRSRFRRKCPGVGSVSRKIIEASESEVKELLSRRFDEMRLVLVVSSRDAAFDGISKRRRSKISGGGVLDRLIPKSPGPEHLVPRRHVRSPRIRTCAQPRLL